MPTQQRCAYFKAPKEGEIGAVVHHMPYTILFADVEVHTVLAIFTRILHKMSMNFHQCTMFLCPPRAERNQRFLSVKNESIKFCCSGGFSNVPDLVEASILFIPTVFHVRSVSCHCLYHGFRASCAARVTRVTHSKRLILGVPLKTQ